MTTNELSVKVGNLSVAVKTWGHADKPPVLALHGWLDNAATFDCLAPYFPDYYWIAPDMPGHGLSENRGAGAEYSLWSYCTEVMQVANAMELDRFTLIGHSMGGGIASLLAGLFPQRLGKLVLLDVLGAIATGTGEMIPQMQKALSQRVDKPLRKAGQYPSYEAAVNARARVGVSTKAAELLGKRGIRKAEGYWYWGHDQRLTRKSLLSLTEEQVAVFLQAIECPVLVLGSTEAVFAEEVIERRAALVRDIQLEMLPGGHHQHLDGDVESVATLIQGFLEKPG